jgi:hypothetical protein
MASGAAISSYDGARHSCRRPPLTLVAPMILPSGEIILGRGPLRCPPRTAVCSGERLSGTDMPRSVNKRGPRHGVISELKRLAGANEQMQKKEIFIDESERKRA